MAVTPLKVFLFLFGCGAAAGTVAYATGSLDPLLGRTPANPAAVAALPEPPPSDPAAPKGERVNEPPSDPGTMMAAAPPADGAAEPPASSTEPPAMAAEPPPADPGTMMAAVPPADDAAQPPAMAAQPPADQAATPPAATPPAGPQAPTFDVVRVEADGSVVVAGKAVADALVELLDGTAVLGSSRATPEGDFAIVLDERLKPGDYQLTLRATPPGGAAIASLQTAVLSIPDKPGGQVLAMVEEPGQASEILTVPQPETPPVPEKPADVAAAPADAPKTDEAAAPPAGQEKPADVASSPPSDQPNPAEAAGQEEKPAEVASAPADANPPKPEDAANGQKPGDGAAAPAKPAEVAAAPPQPAEQAPPEARVAVEAVEIDGGKIFVAGIGDPGRFVRVYANEIVLGETRVGEGGRFLIEANRELPVGKYIIRADLLDADGVKVIARATVPFEREPGESIAAVAPVEPLADKPAEVAAAEQPAPPAAADKPPAVAGETSPPADSSPQPEQPAVAANEPPPTEASPKPEQPAVAANEPPPADGVAADKPAEQPPAIAAAEPPATGDATPPETMSPKLEKVEGAVIIRRSDTLWRISRRVYGRGIRYWTIYLANQNQITNPDKIWPGQVFRVPDKSKEGEAADMSAMGNQVTTVTPQ